MGFDGPIVCLRRQVSSPRKCSRRRTCGGTPQNRILFIERAPILKRTRCETEFDNLLWHRYNIIQQLLNYSTCIMLSSSETHLEDLARQLKVLAEPKRLRILRLLMSGVQCNCELGDALGMPANLISHHLRVLRKAGLVQVERDVLDARWVYYSVNQDAIRELTVAFDAFFDLNRIAPRHPQCGPKRMQARPPKKLVVKPLQP